MLRMIPGPRRRGVRPPRQPAPQHLHQLAGAAAADAAAARGADDLPRRAADRRRGLRRVGGERDCSPASTPSRLLAGGRCCRAAADHRARLAGRLRHRSAARREFQPMNANYGLFPPIGGRLRGREKKRSSPTRARRLRPVDRRRGDPPAARAAAARDAAPRRSAVRRSRLARRSDASVLSPARMTARDPRAAALAAWAAASHDPDELLAMAGALAAGRPPAAGSRDHATPDPARRREPGAAPATRFRSRCARPPSGPGGCARSACSVPATDGALARAEPTRWPSGARPAAAPITTLEPRPRPSPT